MEKIENNLLLSTKFSVNYWSIQVRDLILTSVEQKMMPQNSDL